MKRRYRQDPNTGQLIEIKKERENEIHGIGAEFQPFVSPVDGTWVESRKALEEHNKRNHVAPAEQFQTEIEARTERREAVHGAARFDTAERLESLKLAYELSVSSRSESDKRQIVENFIQHNQHE